METNNIELFEAYLKGSLSSPEQEQVEQRLRTDEAFRSDYEMYQLMVSAITENRKAELKNFIRHNVNVRPAHFFKTPTFYIAAAASVVLCVISYFVIDQKIKEQNPEAYHQEKSIPDTPNQPADSASSVTQTPVSNYDSIGSTKQTAKKNDGNPGDIVAFKDKDTIKKTGTSKDSYGADNHLSDNPENIKVEGDKMKADTFLFVPQKIYISKPKQYRISPTDLYEVVVAGDTRKLEVQCWQSPINYSGYHLNKDLLMLYGNYDATKATFQVLKDVLYMKYKNDYYTLTPNESFSPLKKETDAKIIGDLEIK